MNLITLRLTAYVELDIKTISAEVLKLLRKEFKLKNLYYAKQRSMGYRAVGEPEYYETFFVNPETQKLYFWRGGVKRIRELLEANGYQVRFEDCRTKFDPIGLTLGSLQPFPEQHAAAMDLVRLQQGLLRGHTGSGKSETGLTAAILVDQPTLIIVWNKDLLKQWKDRILKYGILSEREIGIIQGPQNTFGKITIAMIQTLYTRIDEWKDRFGVVINDEVQRVPARTFLEGVLPFSAKYKWGLSADESRRDNKEFLAYETFGYQKYERKNTNPTYYPIAEIKGRGQSLEPMIKIIPTIYDDPKYEEEKQSPSGAYSKLLNRLVKDKDRNDLIAYFLRQELEAGKQIILFTERVESAIWWAEQVCSWGYISGPLIGGTEYAQQTTDMLKKLQSGEASFCSTTSYADVGLDVPSLSCAFITCPTASNIKRMNQQVGRIVRPCDGKPQPIAYYFWDRYLSGTSKHKTNIEKRWENVVTIQQTMS